MKKIGLIFYCITFMLICQPIGVVGAISEQQSAAIIDHCNAIKDTLHKTQKDDSKARVYLGGYYETILSKFVIPMNVRLVENSLSSADLVENQNEISTNKTKFNDDFVNYQRELETLVNMDCKAQPEDFYKKLNEVREKRKSVSKDVRELGGGISDQVNLIKKVREELK